MAIGLNGEYAGVSPWLWGGRDNELVADAGTQLASAVVEPEADSFTVTAWASLAASVALEVQNRGEVIARLGAELDDARQTTFQLTGLEASTAYRVRVIADTGAELVHDVRTAPLATDTRAVRLAVSADVDPYPEFDSELVEHVVSAAPELYVSIGDF